MLFTSCFTGVESTRRVEMSRSDVLATLPTEEDNLISSFSGIPLKLWYKGKEFVALDDRAALIFDSSTLPPSPLSLHLKGKTLRYVGADTRINAGLDTLYVIMFEDSARNYIYKSRQPVATSLDLPMFVDKEIVNRVDSLLSNRTLWVKYASWQTGDSSRMQGLKYAPVKVEKVSAGIGAFPLRIYFQSGDKHAWLPVSLPGNGPASHSFSKSFSLADQRVRYPSVSDENWKMIQQQKVAEGMTKNEVRLALGDPSDVSQGHNQAMVYELWQYSDGSYIMFADGLVIRYKLAR